MSSYPESMFDVVIETVGLAGTSTTPVLVLDRFLKQQLQIAVIFGVRVAMSVVISAILFMVAKTYNSVLFVLYQLNFALILIHASLFIYGLESPGQSISAILTSMNLTSSANRNYSAAMSIFSVLIIYTILATFIFQIYTAFGDTARRTRMLIVIGSIIVCLPCALIWSWYGIVSAIATLDFTYDPSASSWTSSGAWVSFAVTTSVCSVILCLKLWVASRKRARLGVEKFDPIKIILIMTLQNSVVPAVLAIVAASGTRHVPAGFGSIPILMTAAMLPIGYIWAQHRQLVLAARNNAEDTAAPEKTYGTRIMDTLFRRKAGFDASSLPYTNSQLNSPTDAAFEKTAPRTGAASVLSDDF